MITEVLIIKNRNIKDLQDLINDRIQKKESEHIGVHSIYYTVHHQMATQVGNPVQQMHTAYINLYRL